MYILFCSTAFSQPKTGLESYNYLRSGKESVWMPVVHHLTGKGIYTEMRYNYEELGTVSLYGGRSFNGEGKLSYDITPMLGAVIGKYNGGSVAMNIDLGYKKIEVSTQAQYTVNTDSHTDNFFFNWSEFTYQPLKWMSAGLSIQQTKLYKTNLKSEYGLLACFSVKNFSLPVYLFSPFRNEQNIIVGINVEW